jgi:hypothetical protein
MKRLVLFAVVGSGIGAGAALARGDSTAEDGASQPDLKTAAMSGAAAGGFVGLILDRRARRRRKSKLAGYAEKAKPKVEGAVEAAFSAAEIALPKVEAVAEVVRERAKKRAVEVSGVAREKAAEAAIHAKHVAAERADIAKRKAKKSGHKKAAKALDLLPV